ncbi:MAG: cytochrome c biogenesis protein CcdA [Flavobacteriales bacterium]|nr:cytochrome c biogenesis protein CcdA [Flavobacteriales bacterium]
MKRIILLLVLFVSVVVKAQFGDLATVEFSVSSDKEGVYELAFRMKLAEGAFVYGSSDALIAPPELVLNLDSSRYYSPLNAWVFPPFKSKYVEDFEGNVTYYNEKELVVKRRIESTVTDFTISGNYQAQVCNKGRCITSPYPNPKFQIKVGDGGNKAFVKGNQKISIGNKEFLNSKDECNYDFSKSVPKVKTFNGQSIDDNKEDSYWNTFILAFVFGLGALLTPCVFPMIPMTVSFFLKGSGNKSKGKFIAVIFGLSIIVIYCLIGTIFSFAFGPDSANIIATHWLPNVFFFAVFIFFAASFLGMFEITLPSSWSNKSDENADKGGIGGAVFMALTLSLVSFSCTGPIIGTVLVESVKVGGIEPLIGMLGFSSAFALPFTLFAFFPSWLKSLPKSGGWLNSVKVVFGFLELALALKFLSIADQTAHWGILDREVYLALWIVIFTLLGFYLLGKLKFSHDSDLPFLRVPRLVMAIFTFAFVVYLLPGMWGAPLRSLSGYLPPLSTMDFRIGDNIEEGGKLCEKPQFADKLHLPHGLNGYFDYEEGMCCAKDLGKPVFIDFTGHGCVNCRALENNVWSDPEILDLLKNEFVIISLYIDEHTLDIQKPYTSLFDGETKIQTIGQKNADIQKVWFNKNAQPYYVTLGVNEELLNFPIGYDVAEDKAGFLKFLKKSLNNYKKEK